MTNETTVLLEAVKSIIHKTQKPSLLSLDEKTLFELAKENGLVPFLYETFKESSITHSFKKALKTTNLAYYKRHLQHEETIERLRSLFNENSVDFMFLKGVHLKELYPIKHMRASGDIDVLLRDQKTVDFVESILKQAGFTLTMKNPQHDLYTDKNGSTIEVHPTIYKTFNNKYDALFKNEWQHAILLHSYEYRFEPTFELCYLLYHLAKHFDASGVGLRSILDIGLFLDYHYESMDKTHLNNLLIQGNIKTFFHTIVYLNNIYFNLALKMNTKKPITHQRLNQITQYIITSGIHGKGKDFNMFNARRVQEGKTRNRFIVFIQILFPNLRFMKGIYPILNKAPILLPLFWILRILRIVFKRFRTSVYKFSKLFSSSNKDAKETAKLFEDIGL